MTSRKPNDQSLKDQLVNCREPVYSRAQKMPCQTVSFFSAAPRSLHIGVRLGGGP